MAAEERVKLLNNQEQARAAAPSSPLLGATRVGINSYDQAQQSPLCPYSMELEAPAPPRPKVARRPLPPPAPGGGGRAPDSPGTSRSIGSVARNYFFAGQQFKPFKRSQSTQELRQGIEDGSGDTASRPSTPTSGGAAAASKKVGEEVIDEDSLILTIKTSIFLRSYWVKEISFLFLNLTTVGLLSLACRWYPSLLAKLRYVVVHANDPSAEQVLVSSLDDQETLVTIVALDLTDLTKGWQPAATVRQIPGPPSPRMFIWRHERFFYSPSTRRWTRRFFEMKRSYKEIHRMGTERLEETLSDEMSLDRAFIRALTYGDNQLDVNAKPFPVLVVNELLKPFFAFQLFSIMVWIAQAYYIYMYVVIGLSVIAIIQAAYAEYQNLRALERLAKADGVINKIRLARGDGDNPPYLVGDPVSTSSLQPGDIVHVSTNMILPCDVLLLTGMAIMSEAMLTGESAPVLKASLPVDTPQSIFKPDSDRDSKYVLFSGTKVLQAKCPSIPPVPLEELEPGMRCSWEYSLPKGGQPSSFVDMPALGLVLRTGFSTSRGQLIRAILFPKPSKFNFERQTFLFMRILLFALACGITMQVIIYRRNHVDGLKTFLDCLNLVTVAVPPALPLALSIGTSVALARLKSFGIFCSDATRISAAGRVNCLCFDKTGTLTTDGLTLKGVNYVQQHTTPATLSNITLSQEIPVAALNVDVEDERGEGHHSSSNSSSNNGPSRVVRSNSSRCLGDMVTDVTDLHSTALDEMQRNRKFGKPLEENHKLMLSYVMAACHSISILDQTDDATALVLRLNSEIITDPSLPEHRQPETVAMLEERGLRVEQLVIDPEHDQLIHVKVDYEELDEVIGRGDTATGNEEDQAEPILDLPTITYSDNKSDKVQHLVGDTLEILSFQQSGWRYCVRPSEPPNLAELFRSMGTRGSVNLLFRDGAFDDFNIWRHPQLASYVDTVMLPPKSVKASRHASAIAILRRFDFDSDLRRMAALIRTLPNPEPRSKVGRQRMDEGQYFLLSKGAPESIKEICIPETIPPDFEAQLQRLTLSGYRVLACGTRSLEHLSETSILKGSREELEKNLTFVGLLVMENSLKEETEGYLREYQKASFRQIMVTGDNPLTAVAVAKMAGPAFLCGYRRSLLVDYTISSAPSTGNGGRSSSSSEMRLTVFDILDPNLRWDLVDFLKASLPPDALLVAASASTGGGGGQNAARVWDDVGGDGGGGGPKPIPLAEVDFICTGRAFAMLYAGHSPLREEEDPDGYAWTALEVVLLKCNVFARMSPQNKQELMRLLQDLEYVVCMTGDGANDSGALKAADIGISIASAKSVLTAPTEEGEEVEDDPENAKISTEISTSEAAVIAAPSIAAPFATGLHHIGAVSTVVTEGRGTLATSFTMFKYMFLYGIVQFCGVLILYYYLLELSPMQYLWADLFVVLPFATFMPSMEALPTLKRGKPECNLVSFPVMRSVFGHTALIILFQLYQQWMLIHEPSYTPPDYDAPDFDRQVTVASSSKFIYSNFQYIFLAIALCQTYGLFRVPIYKNIILSALVVVEVTASIFIVLIDWPMFDHLFQVEGQELSHKYRIKVLLLGLITGLTFVLYERFFVPHKSLDEDPLVAAGPRTVRVISSGQAAARAGEDDVIAQYGILRSPPSAQEERKGGMWEEGEEGEEERERWLWKLLDRQLTILPKLFHKTPLYHQGTLMVQG